MVKFWLLGLLACGAIPVAAQTNPAPAALLSNGDFERDANGDGAPDDWGAMNDGRSWIVENGNHFLRFQATKPDQTLSVYRLIDVPAGARALQLKWRQRVMDLKVGKEAWFDARIMMNFKNAQDQVVKGGPNAPYARDDVPQWQAREITFLVPADAKNLEIIPALFNVQSGTFDLDDIALNVADAAPLVAAQQTQQALEKRNDVPIEAPQRDKWPSVLHVAGAQVLAADGKPVWLQGVNVPSLEWSAQGENITASLRMAIENWNANVIRLPVHADYWFGKAADDGGAAYRKRVDEAVNFVANRGAYLLLDLHQYQAPHARDLEFWVSAASRYREHPSVIFGLLNEPHSISWDVWRDGGFVADEKASDEENNALTPGETALGKRGFHSVGMQAVLNEVRATGAQNIVVVGGLDWAYDLSGIATDYALKDSTGRGIIYDSHVYNWKRDWQDKVLAAAAKYPVILGEVGADAKKLDFIPLDAQEDPATWVPDALGLIQKYRLHWTGWSFHPGATPIMIFDWDYTPTPFWGALAKRALQGEQFTLKKLR